MSKQGRRWCFTLNNYTPEEEKHIIEAANENSCRYLVFGREIGSHGTPHLQGYVEFKSPKRAGAVKTFLGGRRVHVEVSRGTSSEASDYCKKDGDYFESGACGGHQGHRSDLDQAVELISSGATVVAVAQACPAVFVRYHRGLERLVEIHRSSRNWVTQVLWRYGETGTGKSRDTRVESQNFYEGAVCWVDLERGHFFNGYEGGCKGVVLDEFDGSLPLCKLLRLLDRTPIKVPIKGGSAEWTPRILWITTQRAPEYYYGGDHQWDALRRRLRENGEVMEYSWTLNWNNNKKEKTITYKSYDDE